MPNPENMLVKMIENDMSRRVCSTRDEEGYIFVDRCPRMFRYVLQYLHSGRLAISSAVSRGDLLAELEYFQLLQPATSLHLSHSFDAVQPPQPPPSAADTGPESGLKPPPEEFQTVMKTVRDELTNWSDRAETFFNRNAVAIARKIAQEVAGGATMATVLSFAPADDRRARELGAIEFSFLLKGTDFHNLRSLPPEIFIQYLVYIIRVHTGFRTRASRYSGSRWITVYFPIGPGDLNATSHQAVDAFMDMVSTDSSGTKMRVAVS